MKPSRLVVEPTVSGFKHACMQQDAMRCVTEIRRFQGMLVAAVRLTLNETAEMVPPSAPDRPSR